MSLLTELEFIFDLTKTGGWEGYLNAERGDGDFHGQAPVLWCASALLR
jgi:hypothetical protein